MTDELWRLRAQLSSLQSLLTLSKLMGDSGDQQRIAELAGTAVPSPARPPSRAGPGGRRRLGSGRAGRRVGRRAG